MGSGGAFKEVLLSFVAGGEPPVGRFQGLCIKMTCINAYSMWLMSAILILEKIRENSVI